MKGYKKITVEKIDGSTYELNIGDRVKVKNLDTGELVAYGRIREFCYIDRSIVSEDVVCVYVDGGGFTYAVAPREVQVRP